MDCPDSPCTKTGQVFVRMKSQGKTASHLTDDVGNDVTRLDVVVAGDHPQGHLDVGKILLVRVVLRKLGQRLRHTHKPHRLILKTLKPHPQQQTLVMTNSDRLMRPSFSSSETAGKSEFV